MARRFLAALLAGAGFAACAVAAAPTVSDGWIRALPGDSPAGGYFTLHNPGKTPLLLTGVNSPACGMAMLHKTAKIGGTVRMMMVDNVAVPAGGTLRFEPGGYHVMCMNPNKLKPGTSVKVTLTFADGTSLTTNFAVKNATGQ